VCGLALKSPKVPIRIVKQVKFFLMETFPMSPRGQGFKLSGWVRVRVRCRGQGKG
jgi:hypothetical protein